MDRKLYTAVTEGNLEELKQILTFDPEILFSRTPQQNTALHIAARFGHCQIAEIILKKCKTIILEKNIDGDTPLHIASKHGKYEFVDFLISYSVGWPIDIDSEEGGPLTQRNRLGNTALHEAVTHGNSCMAFRLLRGNPNLGHMLNGKEESPLHIAAREGLTGMVKEILKQPWVESEEETRPAVYGTGSALHQAVLGGHLKIVLMLLSRKSDIVKQVDRDGNNALHYAVQKQNDNAKMVETLILQDSSLAYGNNRYGQSPLHLAVQYGSLLAIEAILKYCPYAAEQVGRDGGNAFHVAVNCGKHVSLKCLLEHIQIGQIINHKDNNGNTPLHLAAKQSKIQLSLLLLKDITVNPCLLNEEGQTARSVIEQRQATGTATDMYVLRKLKKLEAKRCKKQVLPPAVPIARRRNTTTSNEYYTVVAALIATVAFSAILSMPGGYNQTTGIAIHGNKAAFKPFVISNTIAICSALVVVFIYIWNWRDPVNFQLNQQKWCHLLTIIACLSMIVSLMTAVYLVVGPDSRWLSIVVIAIGCSTPILVCFIVGYDIVFIPMEDAIFGFCNV